MTERLTDAVERLRARKLLAMLLPPVHRACLKLLLDFLCEVAANEPKNRMGIANLAVVFAPSLFFIRGQKGCVDASLISSLLSLFPLCPLPSFPSLPSRFHLSLTNVLCFIHAYTATPGPRC